MPTYAASTHLRSDIPQDMYKAINPYQSCRAIHVLTDVDRMLTLRGFVGRQILHGMLA